jgi:hypothetical protein
MSGPWAILDRSERYPMIRFERDSQRLVLQSGPTRIVLDKIASKALLEHKSLPWERDPVECPLSAISGARVSTATDDESKAEICSLTLVVQGGDGWVLAAADKQNATTTATAVREFLGIAE